MERNTESLGRTAGAEQFNGFTEAEVLERLERALARMPERRRAVFLAARQEGLGYAEIAERNGIAVRQVEREIAAAVLQLDDAVAGRVPWWRRLFRALVGGCD